MIRTRFRVPTRLLLVAASVALVSPVAAGLTAAPARADANAVPNYEIKLNLGPTALDATGAPTATVRTAFGIGMSSKSLSYNFFDTSPLDLNGAGWSARLRHKSGKDFDLNYKKRFPITGGNIDAALTTANQQGFDSSDTNYAAQVDWTYTKQTLSFANSKSHSASGYSGTSMPSESTGRGWLVNEIPGKLEDWNSSNWGKDTLAASRQHGPVTSKEWAGTWQGVEISIEVLPIKNAAGTGTEQIVELSFKTNTLASATSLRSQAITIADAGGWLLQIDVLKTNLILTRY